MIKNVEMKHKQISISEFEHRLDEVEDACKRWLKCELETSALIRIFGQHANNKVTIEGYGDFPDDFDWHSISKDFSHRCEKAIENEIRVHKLIATSKIASENLEKGRSKDSIFNRALCFGRAAAPDLEL